MNTLSLPDLFPEVATILSQVRLPISTQVCMSLALCSLAGPTHDVFQRWGF